MATTSLYVELALKLDEGIGGKAGELCYLCVLLKTYPRKPQLSILTLSSSFTSSHFTSRRYELLFFPLYLCGPEGDVDDC